MIYGGNLNCGLWWSVVCLWWSVVVCGGLWYLDPSIPSLEKKLNDTELHYCCLFDLKYLFI